MKADKLLNVLETFTIEDRNYVFDEEFGVVEVDAFGDPIQVLGFEFDEDSVVEPKDEAAGTWKTVIRNGKKVRKYFCPEGYKVVTKGGKKSCKKMTAEEIKKAKLRAKKVAKKLKAKMAQIVRKRKKSMAKK